MSDLTEVPESFASGTTVEFTVADSDHPANGGWTMTLSLAGAGVLTVTAAASGAAHAFAITAEQTAALPAGRYRWARQASKAGKVVRVASGQVLIEPNLDAALAGELQSSNEKLLAAIEAVIARRLGTDTSALPKDIEAYSIDGVTVTKVPLEQLQKFRVTLAHAVHRERGGGFGRQYRVAFTSGDS